MIICRRLLKQSIGWCKPVHYNLQILFKYSRENDDEKMALRIMADAVVLKCGFLHLLADSLATNIMNSG